MERGKRRKQEDLQEKESGHSELMAWNHKLIFTY